LDSIAIGSSSNFRTIAAIARLEGRRATRTYNPGTGAPPGFGM
jgi:hypothetical protein